MFLVVFVPNGKDCRIVLCILFPRFTILEQGLSAFPPGGSLESGGTSAKRRKRPVRERQRLPVHPGGDGGMLGRPGPGKEAEERRKRRHGPAVQPRSDGCSEAGKTRRKRVKSCGQTKNLVASEEKFPHFFREAYFVKQVKEKLSAQGIGGFSGDCLEEWQKHGYNAQC